MTLAAFVYTDDCPFFESTKPDASACEKQTQVVSAVLQFFWKFSLASSV